MKILHTSDWHLGKRLEDFARQEEQENVLKEICEIADQEQVQAVIISGDLFDTYNPPADSIELFYRTVKRLANNGQRAVIAIAGNHDSPDRIQAPDPLARECGIILAGHPDFVVPVFSLESGIRVLQSEKGFFCLSLPGTKEELRVLVTPYANELRLRSFLGNENSEEELRNILKSRWHELAANYCNTEGINILVSHLFFVCKGEAMAEEPDDEKPILYVGGAQAIFTEDIPEQIQYAALGHLHRKQMIDNNPPVVYSGSPLSYSFGEADQQKFVLIVELNPGLPALIKDVKLQSGKRLLRKKAYSTGEALEWLSEHPDCLVELTMSTENFLSPEEKKQLFAAHKGIVSVIPDVKNKDQMYTPKQIDLTRSMEELFIDYFRHIKNQVPNETLLNLFKEIQAEDNNKTQDL